MTHFPHQLRMRLQPPPESRLGISLSYLLDRHYDVTREVETILEARFLPFALKHHEDPDLGLMAAHESIGKLEGMIQAIRSLYSIDNPRRNDSKSQEYSTEIGSEVSQPELGHSEPEAEMEMSLQMETNAFLFGSRSGLS
jgi:hypothetical protein